MEKQETTYYRFLSEVRAFLAKLIKEPIKAEPSKYLKDRDFTKSKLIKDLMSRDVLERHEKILDSTNSDEKTAKYVVKYKVKKKDFEKRIHKIYIKYFEKNEPDKENINEDGESGVGDIGYDVVFGGVQRRKIYAEKKKPKRVYITEKQYQMLTEMGIGDAGDIGDYAANGLELKTSDGKEDPCAKAGKIKVKMVMDK